MSIDLDALDFAARRSGGLCYDYSVPRHGWECIDYEDLGDLNETCEWCGTTEIRYVHVMEHPNYPETVRVGCVCAERMGEPEAKKRERKFKRNPGKLKVILALDRLLLHGRLSDKEREFVSNMRAKVWSARIWEMTPRQDKWVSDIYRREVSCGRVRH